MCRSHIQNIVGEFESIRIRIIRFLPAAHAMQKYALQLLHHSKCDTHTGVSHLRHVHAISLHSSEALGHTKPWKRARHELMSRPSGVADSKTIARSHTAAAYLVPYVVMVK